MGIQVPKYYRGIPGFALCFVCPKRAPANFYAKTLRVSTPLDEDWKKLCSGIGNYRVPVMTFQTAAAPETVGFGNHVYNHLTRTSYGICEDDPCGPSWFIPVAFI